MQALSDSGVRCYMKGSRMAEEVGWIQHAAARKLRERCRAQAGHTPEEPLDFILILFQSQSRLHGRMRTAVAHCGIEDFVSLAPDSASWQSYVNARHGACAATQRSAETVLMSVSVPQAAAVKSQCVRFHEYVTTDIFWQSVKAVLLANSGPKNREGGFANTRVCCQNGALLWLDEANRAVCCNSDAEFLMPMSNLDVTVSSCMESIWKPSSAEGHHCHSIPLEFEGHRQTSCLYGQSGLCSV